LQGNPLQAAAPGFPITAPGEEGCRKQLDEGREALQLDKDQIVQMLRDRGEHDKATRRSSSCRTRSTTNSNGDLLQRLGVDPKELVGKL
jgi:predicted Rossmann fold nucleotide-binding protein DprA/Smf involved in DNA uptake